MAIAGGKYDEKQLRSLVGSMNQSRLLEASDFSFHKTSQSVFFLGHDHSNLKQLYTVDYSKLPHAATAPTPATAAADDGKSSSSSAVVIPVPAQWKPLVSFPGDFHSDREMTEAEKLMRERTRQSAHGVTAYTYNATHRKLLVPTAGTLYVTDVPDSLDAPAGGQPVLPLALREVKAEKPDPTSQGAVMDAKFSPDTSLIAFNRGPDLFVIDSNSGVERRLTNANRAKDVTCGLADYIMAEEFDRFTGYWWCPTVAASSYGYRILFMEVDESLVPTIGIARPTTGTVDTMRFPRAGQTNARTIVKIAQFKASGGVEHFELKVPVHDRWQWVEYIPRAGWISDGTGDRFWLQLVDRAQQRLVIVVLSIANDCVKCSDSPAPPPHPDAPLSALYKPTAAADKKQAGDAKAGSAGSAASASASASAEDRHGFVYEETTKVWVNITNHTYSMADGSALLFGSERSGHRHLYLIPLPKASAAASALPAPITVTAGDWAIDKNSLLVVDEASRTAYFTGNRESAIEKHLYAASLPPLTGTNAATAAFKPREAQRLTPNGNWNDVCLSEDGTRFVTAYSNVQSVTHTAVAHVTHAASSAGAEVAAKYVSSIPMRGRAAVPAFPVSAPELITFPSTDGKFHVHGAVFKPKGGATAKHPLVVHLYGGPAVQLVTNSERFAATARFQMLASLGFVVAVCDGRGSARRGIAYEAPLRDKMGQVEVQDQVALVAYVAAQGWCDPKRVCCTGWSYGGYLSLMCLAQRPDVFKVAVCGAPVTDWAYYDTGYTERYMSTPQLNAQGYKLGNVVSLAKHFPDEEHRLLIAHGLIDENVHFTHTAVLVHALVQANKPYELKVFPEERHGIRSQQSSLWWELYFLRYTSQHL